MGKEGDCRGEGKGLTCEEGVRGSCYRNLHNIVANHLDERAHWKLLSLVLANRLYSLWRVPSSVSWRLMLLGELHRPFHSLFPSHALGTRMTGNSMAMGARFRES